MGKIAFALVLTGLLIELGATSSRGQSYSIDWHAIDNGGGTSTGGGYSMSGTIGQPVAGTMIGGGYTLGGGFWRPGDAVAIPVTIFDNTSGSVNGGVGVTADTWLASKFCLGPQSYQLDSISLLLNSQDFSGAAGPPCAVRLQIYSHNPVSGKPAADTGVIMSLSGLTNPITLQGGQQLVKWTPATPFSLLANTCYWAVLSAENGKRMGQIASFTLPTGDAGTLGQTRSTDAGTTWLAPSTGDNFKMLIQGMAASPPLVISAVRFSGNELRFSFPTSTGRSYVIESQTGLAAGVWTEVPGTLQTSAGDPFEVNLPILPAQPQQFFRVKQLP